jgi:hypothetical protein
MGRATNGATGQASRIGLALAFGSTLAALAARPALASFIGDLVYCDADCDGRYEPGGGDVGLDGVVVRVRCRTTGGATCAQFSATTGQTHSSIAGQLAFFDQICAPSRTWSANGDRTGRYLVEVLQSCADHDPDGPYTCTVTVDGNTLPASCNRLVTPQQGGPPSNGNADGDFCDAEDGPFPENQPLGNLAQAFGTGLQTCEQAPDAAPGDARFTVTISPIGGDDCAIYNDFGYCRPPETTTTSTTTTTTTSETTSTTTTTTHETTTTTSEETTTTTAETTTTTSEETTTTTAETTTTTSEETTTTTPTTTSTTSTTVCVPVPENTTPLCTDTIDNDCDRLIDCADPDCAEVVPCKPIRRDPARISFGPPGAGLDIFRSHGRIVPSRVYDLRADAVGWLVSNARGAVYRGLLQPGDLVPDESGSRFFFTDADARAGTPSRGGLYKVKLLIGSRGNLYYWVKAYGDLSAATDGNLALQFYVGSQAFIVQGEWRRTPRGWMMQRSEFVEEN